jgi:hypothetical protein
MRVFIEKLILWLSRYGLYFCIFFTIPIFAHASYWGEIVNVQPHASAWPEFANDTIWFVKMTTLSQGIGVMHTHSTNQYGLTNAHSMGTGEPLYAGGDTTYVENNTYAWKLIVCSDDTVKFYIDNVLQVSGIITGVSGWTYDSEFWEADMNLSHTLDTTFTEEQPECSTTPPPEATTTSTTTPAALSFSETLFLFNVGLFFLSFMFWNYLFNPIGRAVKT